MEYVNLSNMPHYAISLTYHCNQNIFLANSLLKTSITPPLVTFWQHLAFLIHQLVLGAWTRTEKQIYSDMNVGHGRPRFQDVKLISYGSTSCNFFKYLSLASLDCKLSKYLDKNNSGRLSRRFRCAYFRCHFLLKLSKQLEVVLQLAHSNCCHRR